jgi:hypothetical protein
VSPQDRARISQPALDIQIPKDLKDYLRYYHSLSIDKAKAYVPALNDAIDNITGSVVIEMSSRKTVLPRNLKILITFSAISGRSTSIQK